MSGIPLPALKGPWSSGHPDDAFDIGDPATGAVIATVHGGGEAEVDAAVRRARAAFAGPWRQATARERGALLQECSRVIRDHADELAALETLEMGKPLAMSRAFDVQFCIDSFAFYAGLADKLPGAAFDLGPVAARTVHEPYGTPFGGFKDSGYGREHAIESMLEFTRIKNIREPSGNGTIPVWAALNDVLPDPR